jgi:hypothetical protein
MPQRTSRTNGSNPLEAAVESIEREFERLQKELRSRSRDLEKRIEKGRRQLETRGRKQVKSLLSDVRKSPAYKRARSLRKDAEKQIESGVENVLGLFQIASKRDLARIDRKIQTLNKKLSSLEKTGSPRTAARSEARPGAPA